MTNNSTDKPFVPRKDISPTLVSMVLRGFGLILFVFGIVLFANNDLALDGRMAVIIICIGFGLNLFGIHSQIYLLIDIKDALQERKKL